MFSLTAGGRFHLLPPGQRFRPWIVTEFGWYHANSKAHESFCGRSSCGPPYTTDEAAGDGVGVDGGAGFDVVVTDALSLGLETRYHRAFVLGNFGFLTTMATFGIHF